MYDLFELMNADCGTTSSVPGDKTSLGFGIAAPVE
jgi:hypothetical protein